MKTWLTVAEGAVYAGVSRDTIYTACERRELLPVPKGSMAFYDFDEYERLVAAASAIDATAHLIVLLGGEAGLRCGEMIALDRLPPTRPPSSASRSAPSGCC
jgi:hypothetical protein